MALRRAKRKQHDPEGRMSVMDHLRELRRRLIVAMVIIALGAVVGWVLYVPILHILERPYCNVPLKYRLHSSDNSCALLFRGPLDGFTIRLKVSVIAGAIITAPLWLYQIWKFVTPGLRRNERKWSLLFIGASSGLFALGMALAYFTLYRGLDVLISSAGTGVQSALDVTSYISFVTLVLVIFGISFELPLLVIMANAVGVLPYSILRRGQRLSIFLIFLFAAIATPSTDPFTMTAMAIPMCVLFELAVLWSFLHDRRKARREVAAEGAQLDDETPSQVDPIPEPIEPPSVHDQSQLDDLP